MNYENYLKWMSMTYEQFETAMNVIATKFAYLLLANAILTACQIFIFFYLLKHKLNRKTEKKWKAICKMEHRKSYEQEKFVIEKFIEEYAITNRINWYEH